MLIPTAQSNSSLFRLKAAPRIDPLKIEAIRADSIYGWTYAATDPNRSLITTYVASWTLVEDNIQGKNGDS